MKPIVKSVALEVTPIGEAYVRTMKYGPYIRYSHTQENHLDDGLIHWMRKSTPEEIQLSERTADQGTLLHRYFHSILTGAEIAVPEEEQWVIPVVQNFKGFRDKVDLKPSHLEVSLTSEVLGIGGTIDFIGDANIKGNDEKSWIMDWKTGGIHESYGYQLAIYKFMAIENGIGNDGMACAVCQFHRDGKEMGFKKIEDIGRYLLGALHTFERWKQDRFEKLKWVMAPAELVAERNKSRGKNRAAINETWKEEYAWPWLFKDSISDAREFLKGTE